MSYRYARAMSLVVLVAVLVTCGALAYRWYIDRPAQVPVPPSDPVPGKPEGRLVVLVVFDQMRGDYLDRWAPHFGPEGFERLKKEGVWYSDAQIPYACTSTGPGHASIVSGAPPSAHGIVENEWYDRKAGGRVYCCQPSREYPLVPPVPGGSANRGSKAGFSPESLLAETVGDKLKASGAGRVVSLSIKDRTAVLMGGRKPDAVYCFDTRDGLFHTGAYYREQVHPWAAEFNAGRPAGKWFGKPWNQLREDIDYRAATGQPDAVLAEDRGVSQGLIFPHPTDGGLPAPGPKYYEALETSPFGNDLLLELAKKAVAAEGLGTGSTDLLCVSFSSNDLVGHRWGPDSWEVFDVTLRSDRLLADLLAFLDSSVGKGRYTLVVTADHGVCPLPELEKYPGARRVKTSEIYSKLAEKLNNAFGPAPSGPTQWFEVADPGDQEAVWPWVYLNHRAVAARGLTVEEVAAVVRERLAGLDFIETAFTRKDLESGKFEAWSFGGRAKLAYHPDRCGDVIDVTKAGVLVTRYSGGTSHGTPHPYDTHVPVLAVGAGVPALGKRADRVSSLVVAPILAKALGVGSPAQAAEPLPPGWGN